MNTYQKKILAEQAAPHIKARHIEKLGQAVANCFRAVDELNNFFESDPAKLDANKEWIKSQNLDLFQSKVKDMDGLVSRLFALRSNAFLETVTVRPMKVPPPPVTPFGLYQDYYSPKEVMKMIKKTRATLHNLKEEGLIPEDEPGKFKRYSKAKLIEFFTNHPNYYVHSN